MKKVSIKTKLVFFGSILMTVSAIILSWYFLTSASNLLRNELIKRGMEITHNLAYTSRDGILTENLFHELDSLIEAAMLNPDIVFVALLNKHGKVLAHTQPKEIGKSTRLNQCTICHGALAHTDPKKMSSVYRELTKKIFLSKDTVCLGEKEETIHFGRAVAISTDKKSLIEEAEGLDTEKPGVIGAVLLGISLKGIHVRTNNILKVSLGIILILVVIGIALSFFFSSRITTPIISLTKTSHAISSGDLGNRVEIKTNDEIGELAVSFNQMAENLKKAMDELSIEKKSLEQKVQKRTQELEEANIELKTRAEELESVNKELDAFTYSASHDLKEPLRGIASFSQFLLEDYADKLDNTGKNYLKRLIASAVRMKTLIDDLLALSRISRIKNPYTSVDSGKLVREAIKGLRAIIDEKGAKIKIDNELPFVFCDEVKIRSVFYNLISNAIKYNDKKCPEIEIGSDEQGADGAVFFVKDNGIGIKEEHFDDIFGIFKRLHGKDEYGGGTGVGLAIVKRVINDHGGKVWVKSTSGEGSMFCFNIPRN